MITFKGVQALDVPRLVIETSSGREQIIQPNLRPVRGAYRWFPHAWGDDFDDIDQVYQVAFDILYTTFQSNPVAVRIAAIFCKSFAEEFLVDCGSSFEITAQQVKDWHKAKTQGVKVA